MCHACSSRPGTGAPWNLRCCPGESRNLCRISLGGERCVWAAVLQRSAVAEFLVFGGWKEKNFFSYYTYVYNVGGGNQIPGSGKEG